MLAPEQFFTWNAGENKAIARFVPALDEAVASGRPIAVDRFPTTFDSRQLVALAVDVVRRAGVNVAVLAGAGHKALTFVPLAVSPVIRPKRPRTIEREVAFAGAEVHV
jgi:hypothetical protein